MLAKHYISSQNILSYFQNISLGLLRSDYLLHNDHEIKQVEINTVATSFAALATVTTRYHR